MVNGGAELGLWLQLKGQQAFRLGFDPPSTIGAPTISLHSCGAHLNYHIGRGAYTLVFEDLKLEDP